MRTPLVRPALSRAGRTLGLALALCAVSSDLVAQRGREPTLRSGVSIGKALDVSVEWAPGAFTRGEGIEGATLEVGKDIVLGAGALVSGRYALSLKPLPVPDGAWALDLAPAKRRRGGEPMRIVLPSSEDERAEPAGGLRIGFELGEEGSDAEGGGVLCIDIGAKVHVQIPVHASALLEKAFEADKALSALGDAAGGVATSGDGWRTSVGAPDFAPAGRFDDGARYYWSLLTDQGLVVVKLRPDAAPRRVAATAYLTRTGFYDGLSFHRVITGFMAQGGCPQGTGNAGPDFAMESELSDAVRHDRPGIVSMANSGPGTEASQFFITFAPTPHLDGKHTIFGEVVRGMDAVRALEKAGSQGGEPTRSLSIVAARVHVVHGRKGAR